MSIRGFAAGALALALTACQTPPSAPPTQENNDPSLTIEDVIKNSPYGTKKGKDGCVISKDPTKPDDGKPCIQQVLEL